MNFKKMTYLCMQRLTNFPYIEEDFDALTNYELLCKVVEYLNKVIANDNLQNEAIEELATSFTELKNYVDNLDLQDEVNNKLDEMYEDGQLEQIIEQFLQLTSLICFDNVATMKSSTNLTNGSFARTLGYYSANDGGQGLYKIRTITNEDVVDEGSIIALNDNTLIAELITFNCVNVECFGTNGDGLVDDTQKIKNAVLYCKNNNIVLSSAGKSYLITENITIENVSLKFNWGRFLSNQKVITINATNHLWDYGGDRIVNIENVKFNDTNLITSSPAIAVDSLEFSNWHGVAFKVNNVRTVSNIYYNNDRSDADTVSIEINVPDKFIDRLQGKGGFTGIVINANNVTISNSQLWLSDRNRVNNTLDGSKFIHVKNGSGLMFNNCISDTYQYAMYFNQSQIRGSLSNFQVINNNVLYNNTTLYLINGYQHLTGNVIVRMTNFASTNTNFTIGSPCLLDILVYDGTPTDPIRFQNSDTVKALLQNYDGTAIAGTDVTFNTASSIYMKDGTLEMHVDLSFNTPSLQRFYIDTTAISGMSKVRGYEYVQDIASDDSLGYATVERSSNNKILITHRSSGYLKRIAFNIYFRTY